MLHQTLHRRVPVTLAVLLGSVLVACTGCASNRAAFSSPEEAATALVTALGPERDTAALGEIFGPHANDVISSGDDVDDQDMAKQFVTAYTKRHGFEKSEDGFTYLVIGEDEWPFAIPLAERSGLWSFDTNAGLDELVNRRIGRNELDTIQSCLAFVDAQFEYAAIHHGVDGMREYARRIRSSKGKRDGLYWPIRHGEPLSPLGELAADAADDGYEIDRYIQRDERVYNGYRFRILESQGEDASGGSFDYVVDGHMVGGFALVAWPAEYGSSGIMTFIVNHDGIVYEKDLGKKTNKSIRNMVQFNPDSGWDRVNETPFGD